MVTGKTQVSHLRGQQMAPRSKASRPHTKRCCYDSSGCYPLSSRDERTRVIGRDAKSTAFPHILSCYDAGKLNLYQNAGR